MIVYAPAFTAQQRQRRWHILQVNSCNYECIASTVTSGALLLMLIVWAAFAWSVYNDSINNGVCPTP